MFLLLLRKRGREKGEGGGEGRVGSGNGNTFLGKGMVMGSGRAYSGELGNREGEGLWL